MSRGCSRPRVYPGDIGPPIGPIVSYVGIAGLRVVLANSIGLL